MSAMLENTVEYTAKRPPRAWQAKCLPILYDRKAFAVLAGMRTGKTYVIVNDWGRLVHEGKAVDLVVVAPGGAYLPWEEALHADLPKELWIRLAVFVWHSPKARTKTNALEREAFLKYQGPRALIINVEALSMIQAARFFVVDFARQRREKCYVVVDESVTIKSPKSKAGRFFSGTLAGIAGYRRIMSGLVSPRSPSDLFNQFMFLDPTILGYWDFVTFRARYERVRNVCMLPNPILYAKLKALGVSPEGMTRDQVIDKINRLGGYVPMVPVTEKFQNMDELRAKIEPHSFRVRLEDCYDMPPVDYSFRDVNMTDEQQRIYKDLKKKATAQLESLDHVTAQHVITQMLRLHQILCGHVGDENGQLHDVPENRTAALIDLLEDYDGKAIIWVSYDRSVDKVVAALKFRFGEDSVARFWGGNVKTREEEERSFKDDLSCRFMVATPDAGGRGRDWSVADLVVYYSSRNNLDHRQQSEDRAKAVGKSRSIAYVDMWSRGTVEDHILECLRNKIDMSSKINGDNWRSWLI